jgi:hypothetical protein
MPVLGERWSFGAAATAVASGAAAFLPGVLLADARQAVLDGWWRPPAGRPPGLLVPKLADVTTVDDRGVTYALRSAGMSTTSDHPDSVAWPQSLRVRLDPVPARGTGWIEFRGRDGTTARLLPSAQGTARVGPPVPVAAGAAEREPLRHTGGLPGGWAAMPAGAGRRDGPVRFLDLAVTLPPVEQATLRLDTLVSAPDSWRLYLRAAPGLHAYGEPDEFGGRSVREVVSVSAEDDRGGAYVSRPGGNRHIKRGGRESRDHEEHVLRFQPRLDPLARALELRFRGAADEILVNLELS